MGLKIYQVDSFTDKPFAGNPAGVCILPEARSERWMQDVAREMNLAETAFLVRQANGYNLRWFTPAVEVDLCGHATLASAHILWETGQLPSNQEARFHTKSGQLSAKQNGKLIEMNFPSTPAASAEAPPGLSQALGVDAKYVGKSRFDYLMEVESEDTVRGLNPNFGQIKKLPVRGIIVTSRAGSDGCDFVSRFFAPAAGIDEDPVTGSAHCTLAPFWAERLGKKELVGYQASSRGGTVRVRVDGKRVHLGGQAVTVLTGELVNG
ncbi:MAG: PhzF family phenazine biosynthesis protein [candidate division Zixibacteria bacterium]|nr:PhzF family phenazine biosynthesis protein [candidate division Zixibacteria bacterium]